MKPRNKTEIELHNFTHIEKNLSHLTMDSLGLTVPLLGDAVLINSPTINVKGTLMVYSNKPGREFTIHRSDSSDRPQPLLQVVEGDDLSPRYGDAIFYNSVSELNISKREPYLWEVNVPKQNIKDAYMLRDFIGILSVFALTKQSKLRSE